MITKEKKQQAPGAMETGDHFKNGASPKSQMSRGNIFIFFAIMLLCLLYSCNNNGEFSRDDLIGRWDVRYRTEDGDKIILKYCRNSLMNEAITFDNDGTFIQHLGDIRYGKWQIEGRDANKRLSLIYQNGDRIETAWRWFRVSKKRNFKDVDLHMLIQKSGKEDKITVPIYSN